MALKGWNCFYTSTIRIKIWKLFWMKKVHYDCFIKQNVSVLSRSDWEHFLPMQAYCIWDALKIVLSNSDIEARGNEAPSQTPPGKYNDQGMISLLNLLQ